MFIALKSHDKTVLKMSYKTKMSGLAYMFFDDLLTFVHNLLTICS